VRPPGAARVLRQRAEVGVGQEFGEPVARLGGLAVLQGDLGVLEGDAHPVLGVLVNAA
jgi:hypothetical protein